MLPAFEEVAVDLPASEPGEHDFTCQMEMLRGKLIVEERRSPSAEGGNGARRIDADRD